MATTHFSEPEVVQFNKTESGRRQSTGFRDGSSGANDNSNDPCRQPNFFFIQCSQATHHDQLVTFFLLSPG